MVSSQRMIDSHASQDDLDKAFALLADPTRRVILERLTHEREVAVGELAERFSTSLTAVTKHIDVVCDRAEPAWQRPVKGDGPSGYKRTLESR